MLISHADEDHISGLISLIESETVAIGRVRLNSDLAKPTRIWADLLALLDLCHREKRLDFDVALTVRNTDEFNQGEVRIEMLAPSLRLAGMGPGGVDSQGRRLRTNTLSAVVRLSRNEQPSVLLTGDLDEIGFEDMLHHEPNPFAPLLIYPHHGAHAFATDESVFARRLCQTVRPRAIVFSIGRGKHGTPIPEVVAAIRAALPDIRVACTQLSAHCRHSPPEC